MGDTFEDRSSRFEPDKSINTFNRSLEEQLQDPAVKDRLIANLEYLEPDQARELIKIMLWSDSAFSFGMLGQLPRGLNFAIAFLDELGKQLQNVPPHLLREFVAEMIRTLDLESVRALPRAYLPLLASLNLVAGDDPEKIKENQQKKISLLQDTIRTADFGKIRKMITRQADLNYPVMENVIATIVSDPVIFANLLNILPPLLNNLLKATATGLQEIDFPPEILASAVFNLLDDLKAEELGAIITGLSTLINKIHEGSAVLGYNEPRFRVVIESLLEKTLSNFDQKENIAALAALGEDLEVILYAVTDTLMQKPELLEEILPVLRQGFCTGLRSLAYLLEQLNQLPPQGSLNFIQGQDSAISTEAAKLVNALVGLSNRVMEDNPGLLEKSLAGFIQTVDQAEVARLLNRGLISYNKMLTDGPDQVKGELSYYLEQLDQEELSRALLLTSGQLSQTLAGNPRLSRSLLKSFFRLVGGLIRGSLKGERKLQGRQS